MTDQPPILDVEPDSITALFDRDPALFLDPNGQLSLDGSKELDRLIAEFRRRADVNAAELAAAEAAPKTASGRARKPNALVDAAVAAIADKPVSELTLDDLMGGGDGST